MDDYDKTLMETMKIDQRRRLWAAAQHRRERAAVQWDSAWIGH